MTDPSQTTRRNHWRNESASCDPGRRALIRGGVLTLLSATAGQVPLMAEQKDSAQSTVALRIGLITDLHHADKPRAGSRYYRETLGKFAEASQRFADQQADFVVELGDLIDAADSVETELRYLKTIDREFSAANPDRHYVLGNHCVDTLKKSEFLETVGKQDSYYSFDRERFHFVVLDACFRSDGTPYERKNFKWTDANVPPAELEWLAADLAETDKPVIVFAHQRLDVDNHHGVRNGAAVRKILESSKKVVSVFQGHSHKNDLKQIAGIHYCTLVAMIEGSGKENSGYSMLNVHSDGTLELHGFRKQKNYSWT